MKQVRLSKLCNICVYLTGTQSIVFEIKMGASPG